MAKIMRYAVGFLAGAAGGTFMWFWVKVVLAQLQHLGVL